MSGYKRYLFTGGKIPRSTLWYRRKQAELRQRLLYNQNTGGAGNSSTEALHNVAPGQSMENHAVAQKDQPQSSKMQGSEMDVICDRSDTESNSLNESSMPVKANPSTSQLSLLPPDGLQDSDSVQSFIADSGLMESMHMSCEELAGTCNASSSNSSEEFVGTCDGSSSSSSYSDDTDSEKCDPSSPHSSCNEEENVNSPGNMPPAEDPLCPCTEATAKDVMLMTLVLGLRHNLSWEAQVDVLKLIQTIFGDSKISATKYHYLNTLGLESDNIKFHIYCSHCDVYLGLKEDMKGFENCKYCGSSVDVSKASNFFVSVSVESQLKKLFQDRNLVHSLLTHRFNRKKLKQDALEDIYDGSCYEKQCGGGGILSSPYNFSYSFSTDGVPFGKSSNKTIWPIYLTINELPFEDRSKYILLAGLYVGAKDPNQQVFLKPFVEEANRLSSEGFAWTHSGTDVVSRVIPLCAIVDSVARYQLLNHQSFAAYFGCTFCYQKSQRTQRGQRYPIPLVPAEQRTDVSIKEDLREVYRRRNELQEKDRHWRGVKGPTPLLNLVYFSLSLGFVVDYMHAILLGVIRLHTELIFESVRKKFWIGMEDDRLGMKHLINAIDERLTNLKPPSCITRVPRSMKDMKLWKASEWRSWLLFYCIPCLNGFLKDKHLYHLAMLSEATNLLLQKSVTRDEISLAHRLYMSYTSFFQKYFGEPCMVYNVHLLSHVAQGVRNWGPLWSHNAFLYEAQNRHLLQLCKSPSNVVLHIARKFLIYNNIPFLCQKFSSSQNTVTFCENVLENRLKRFVRGEGGCILLGKGEVCSQSPETVALLAVHGVSPQDCLSYQRMIFNEKRFCTLDYTCQGKQNNNSCVYITSRIHAVITKIVVIPSGKVFLFVQEIKFKREPCLRNQHVKLDHIKVVDGYGMTHCIQPCDIACQCIIMHTTGTSYVSKVPFGCSKD